MNFPLSTGIAWFEKQEEESDFYPSHVVIAFNNHEGVEAAARGVQICDLEKYFDHLITKPHPQDRLLH
ncbi:hypothetical protein MBAV_005284 [Candidatus Magnetobacterium bavaricum]|uniref:Uncharacterized protein n=1 Tax=Candidatus Magnetobacterium bavaricum TaxID=29290 RepID=A0A0F3GL16_9BACT|nr:hypothetical protein MBAV_005284 [Candidatus Magnetobacterium bavaricum]